MQSLEKAVARRDPGIAALKSVFIRSLTSVDDDDVVHNVERQENENVHRLRLDNNLQVPSKLVSRRHSHLLAGPNAMMPEDMGSANSSFISSRRIKKQLLRDAAW